MLVDEPEKGLHRQGEWETTRVLESLVEDRNLFVATHSPSLLDLEDALVLHVEGGELKNLSNRTGDLLAASLRPSDLVGTYRGFVLVEGSHDAMLINHFNGDELLERRVKVVSASGGMNFAGFISSGLLFDFSTAPLLIAVDNIPNERLERAWSRVTSSFEQSTSRSDRAKVRQALSESDDDLPPGITEHKFIRETMKRVLESGQHRRVSFFGFTQPDIVMYLPYESFGLSRSWQSLWAEWSSMSSSSRRRFEFAFKNWTPLVDSRSQRLVNETSIVKVLGEFQDRGRPQEFDGLAKAILAL
jgi:hypothetical protein